MSGNTKVFNIIICVQHCTSNFGLRNSEGKKNTHVQYAQTF